jgi:hypothetical protein
MLFCIINQKEIKNRKALHNLIAALFLFDTLSGQSIHKELMDRYEKIVNLDLQFRHLTKKES